MIVKTKKINLEGYKDYIRVLKAKTVMDLAKYSGQKVPDEFMFDILSQVLCDKEGNLLYTPEQVGELDYLTFKDLINEVLEFNGLVEKPFEEAKENLKKDQIK